MWRWAAVDDKSFFITPSIIFTSVAFSEDLANDFPFLTPFPLLSPFPSVLLDEKSFEAPTCWRISQLPFIANSGNKESTYITEPKGQSRARRCAHNGIQPPPSKLNALHFRLQVHIISSHPSTYFAHSSVIFLLLLLSQKYVSMYRELFCCVMKALLLFMRWNIPRTLDRLFSLLFFLCCQLVDFQRPSHTCIRTTCPLQDSVAFSENAIMHL